jgi:hypothetical protein
MNHAVFHIHADDLRSRGGRSLSKRACDTVANLERFFTFAPQAYNVPD